MTYYKLGERSSGLHTGKSIVQDYYELRDKCLRNGTLFEDSTFPADDSSFYLSDRSNRTFQWKRPSEITSNPMFIIEDAHRLDVIQGELGNCWFLAAVANLTLNPELLHKVVPRDQTFDAPSYAGIFHFHFWQYGKWIDVVIDDRLPTINGRLMLMHSKDSNEFWSALLEKAYAKLHGSYEALRGGTTSEALTDFTGGLTEHFDLQTNECPPNLLQIMMKAFQRSSFLGCSIEARDSSEMESEMSNGLIRGHAYSVTSVKLVELSTSRVQGKIPLIRVRNPWGNEAEWKGAWSDKSKEWTVVPEREKKQLGLTFDADGEFWMSFTDFKNYFTRLEICNITPDSLTEEVSRRWEVAYFDGAWVSGISAGGCRNHLNTFHLNPQYLISLVDHDEDDDQEMCTLVVGLMQKNRRIKRKMGLDSLTIGFAIYQVTEGVKVTETDTPIARSKQMTHQRLLSMDYFKYNASVARSPTFINLREISGRFQLKPGKYCVIPSTFDPHEEGEFLVRIITEKPPQEVAENDDEIGVVSEPEPDKANGVTDNVDVEDDKTQPTNESNANTDDTFALCFSFFTALWNRICNSEVGESVGKVETKQSESSVRSFFAKLAGDDMEVDALELQEILNFALKKEFEEFKFNGFSLDSCRSMIAMVDSDMTGKLGFDEFTTLWRNIRNWCSAFKKHDVDGSNTMSAHELRSALQDVGINVNRTILKCLVLRYGIVSSSKNAATHEKSLTFDDFINAALKLKYCIDLWNEKSKSQQSVGIQSPGLHYGTQKNSFLSPQRNANASFTIEEFIEKVIYC